MYCTQFHCKTFYPISLHWEILHCIANLYNAIAEKRLSATLQKMMLHCIVVCVLLQISLQNIALPQIFLHWEVLHLQKQCNEQSLSTTVQKLMVLCITINFNASHYIELGLSKSTLHTWWLYALGCHTLFAPIPSVLLSNTCFYMLIVNRPVSLHTPG